MDMSEYNFSTKDIFDAINKAKSLNRELIKKEDEVAAATTKRIMGEIDVQELSRIADEACNLSGELMSARLNLKHWSRILGELKQSIDNVDRNTNLTEAEIDVLISTARTFSRIDKETMK